MSIENLDAFMTGLAWTTAIAFLTTVVTLASWTTAFLVRNRTRRVARHQALVPYYRDLVLHPAH